MHSTASLFTAELTAILYAVIKSKSFHESRITIITDSKSSIQTVMSMQPRNPLVSEIQAQCHSNQKTYHFCWVPSHVDITGNERADKLARDATKSNVRMNDRLLRIDCKAAIKRKYREEWRNRWSNTANNKLRNITDNLSPLPNSRCSNRKWERVLTRLRIGHSRITHDHLLSGTSNGEPPTCEECPDGVPLTIEHLLTSCPAFNNARRQAFQRAVVTIPLLLNEGNTSPTGPLARYLTVTGLMDKI